MPRGHTHPPAIRAAVVADIVAGMSRQAAARKHGVSDASARLWYQQVHGVAVVIPEKKALDFGDSLAAALTKAIAALAAIADHAGDKAWLNQQSANDLAIFYGVLSDKALRVLQAAEPVDGYLTGGEVVASMAK